MRSSFWYLPLALVFACWICPASDKPEDVLFIAQDYTILEQGKGGADAKDVRQNIYIRHDFLCIDELGGRQGSPQVVESIMVDLKNKLIINVDHQNKKKVVESFEDRRKRLEKVKKEKRDDIEALSAGPQRERIEKLFRAMLDENRKFQIENGEEKELAGVKCKTLKISDSKQPDYVPFEAALHPEIELPYDNTEVLYLLKIIGKHLADYLHENKETFKKVPMELHIDLAAGGRLDCKVVDVKRTTSDKLDLTARGTLGNPFEVPANYTEPPKVIPRSTKEEKP
jgi:hypothetical protein